MMYSKLVLFLVIFGIVSKSFAIPLKKDATSRKSRYLGNDLGRANDCDCVCGLNNRHMRVLGGNISQAHEFPWLAGLYKGGEFFCGGSLITRRHILTAAHCAESADVNTIRVVLGDHDRDSPNRLANIQVRNLVDMVSHKSFELQSYNNDIAILEMDYPVEFDDKIQPVCLPGSVSEDYTGAPAIVAGWGKIGERTDTSRILRKVVVPVWSSEKCHSSGYGQGRLSENMICAGYEEGEKDACQGDSGGPLHMKTNSGYMELIGIVSFGRGCGRQNFPGIYTKVTNYLNWVSDNLNGDCLCSPPA